MTTYSQHKQMDVDVDLIVELARENPKGFLELTRRYCKTVTVSEVERSMRAWGINPEQGHSRTRRYAKGSNNRTSRRRENISYPSVQS